jgi:hypothetical protein
MQITADIADLPLGQALEALSQKIPLDIRGSVAGDERLTLHFSQLTLQQALRKMMAGYNYVLIRPEALEAPVLVILGKAEKGTISVSVPGVGDTMPGPGVPAPVGPPLATAPLPTLTGLPSSLPVAPSVQSSALPPSSSEAPPPLAVPAAPSYDEAMPSPSSVAAAPSSPVGPPPATPMPAGPASAVQTATTGQGNQPPDSSAQGPAGVTPNPDSQPEFNPAAWGGRGFRGSPAPTRK